MSPELHRLNLMRTENLSYSYLYSCSAQSRCSLRTDRMKKYKKPLVRYTIVDLWGILRYFINAWGGKFTLRRMLKTLFLLLLISYYLLITYYLPSLVAQTVKHLPTMRETWVQSLGQENPLKKGMATHSSILAWKIPWTEEPGRLQSTGHKESDTTERLSTHTHVTTTTKTICK